MSYATLGLCPAPDPDQVRPCVKVHILAADDAAVPERLAAAGWCLDAKDQTWTKAAPERYDFVALAHLLRQAHTLGARWVLYPEPTKWRHLISQNLGWSGTDKPSVLEASAQERAAVEYALLDALGIDLGRADEALAAFDGLKLSVLPDATHQEADPDVEPAGPMVVTVRPAIFYATD